MIQKVFQRYEKKYLLEEETYQNFRRELAAYMQEDAFGLHTIRNLYFDTEDDILIRTSIEKPRYKEKFRIRCYGDPTEEEKCFLEIKKKYHGLVNKRRIVMGIDEAQAFIERGIEPEKKGQIFQEVAFFLDRYDLQPKCYIAYDRIALYGKEDPDFRVTFDTNIRSRSTNLTLYSDDDTQLLLSPKYHLMEVKISETMPLWFAQLLSKYQIYSTSFSKFGRVYEKQQKEGRVG